MTTTSGTHKTITFDTAKRCTDCCTPATGWHYPAHCGCGQTGWEVLPCGCRHAGVMDAITTGITTDSMQTEEVAA